MTNLIIFGAGASYGSDINNTPPLGSNLFSALCDFNPLGWGALSRDLANIFNNDFEAGIVKLFRQNPHSLPVLQRAMAAYFFNFLPHQNNLYIKLSQKIKNTNWDGVLVTLNYERLLELSLINQGLRPIVNRTRVSSEEIEICFPHGCCHLFCDSARGMSGAVSFNPFAVLFPTTKQTKPFLAITLFNWITTLSKSS